LTISGCGRTNNPRPAQAVAKVDGYEITVHEINEVIARMPAQAPGDSAKLQARALDAIIDRRLLVKRALETKLDRDPDVMQSLAAARDEVLAKAYLRTIVGQPAVADAVGVKDYYEKHPQLFSQRKLYEMRHVTIAEQDAYDELSKVINSSQSIDQVAEWLQTKSIKFERAAETRTSADFPPKLIDNLDQLADKRLFVMKQPSRVVIASLSFIKNAPISLSDATPDIQRFLVSQRIDAAVTAEVKRLRSAADISYLNAPDPSGTHLSKGAAGLR
jgi:EpsD family peptidyl-prolyl cis-trans isomerase